MSMEKYNIKTTDTDTLKRWYHLMGPFEGGCPKLSAYILLCFP